MSRMIVCSLTHYPHPPLPSSPLSTITAVSRWPGTREDHEEEPLFPLGSNCPDKTYCYQHSYHYCYHHSSQDIILHLLPLLPPQLSLLLLLRQLLPPQQVWYCHLLSPVSCPARLLPPQLLLATMATTTAIIVVLQPLPQLLLLAATSSSYSCYC